MVPASKARHILRQRGATAERRRGAPEITELARLIGYSDVIPVARDILARVHGVLGRRLVGLYLYGSIATGGYLAGVSDVDLLAVLEYPLDANAFRALDAGHRTLVLDRPEWHERVEVLYVPAAALQTFRQRRSDIVVISPGEPLNVRSAGRDWLMNWYLVQEYGIRLHGPDPRRLIPPITTEEFIDSIRNHARTWRKWIGSKSGAKDQSYAILTMCRALYTCTKRVHVSKEQAAGWAADELPDWRTAIERALLYRTLRRDDPQLARPETTIDETRRFVSLVADRIGQTP